MQNPEGYILIPKISSRQQHIGIIRKVSRACGTFVFSRIELHVKVLLQDAVVPTDVLDETNSKTLDVILLPQRCESMMVGSSCASINR